MDASWVDKWNIHDDLKDWRNDRDELSRADPAKDMHHVEGSDSNSKEPTEDNSSEDSSEDNPALW